ncbi:MAG: APC family permease [Chitinophagaceae bacterium]|nr:MAG: APC family permease [Chitinophagaceae bacterium]
MTAKNKLGVFDLTMIVVSLVIGMGIFRTPANVAAASPTPFVFYLAWIMGGVVALCGALTYAEIGSRLPVTGGYYKVFSYAYHPSIAFSINCIILVSNAASASGVALIGSEYISSLLFPGRQDPVFMQNAQIAIAIGAIVIFYFVNMLGLKMSSRTQSVLTVIKICLVILLITPLFLTDAAPASSTVDTIRESVNPVMWEYIKAFGVGLVAVSFTFGGYQQTINFGAEVEQPNKNTPRGIFAGIFLIIVLYMLINYAYVHTIGFEQLKTSKNIAAIMASRVFGVNAERILSILLFLGVLAYVNVLLLSNPRVMYAMVDDKILPPAFQKTNSRGALTVGLSVFGGMAAFIVFFAKEFDTLLSFTIFLDSIGMVLSAGSIFILRKKTAHLDNTGIYKMKLYPLLPLIFMAAYTFVAFSLLKTETALSLIGIGVMLGFLLLYFLIKGFKPSK